MQTHYANKTPSKRLTAQAMEWYTAEQNRAKAAKTEREYIQQREDLGERILGLIDKGYAPVQGSNYGVMVLEQSSRIAYESLYNDLVRDLTRKLPEKYSAQIKTISLKLEKQALKKLDTKRVIMCAENSKLEETVKRLEKKEDGKIMKQVELVMYT